MYLDIIIYFIIIFMTIYLFIYKHNFIALPKISGKEFMEVFDNGES